MEKETEKKEEYLKISKGDEVDRKIDLHERIYHFDEISKYEKELKERANELEIISSVIDYFEDNLKKVKDFERQILLGVSVKELEKYIPYGETREKGFICAICRYFEERNSLRKSMDNYIFWKERKEDNDDFSE